MADACGGAPVTHPCTGCGRFCFPAPRQCWWCLHPTTEEDRAARVKDGIAKPEDNAVQATVEDLMRMKRDGSLKKYTRNLKQKRGKK